jgi:hypothetical protein
MRIIENPVGYNKEYIDRTLVCGVCGEEYEYDPKTTTASECSYSCATGG